MSRSKIYALIILFSLGISLNIQAQEDEIKLRYFGTAGWEITDGAVTVLVDPYISRLKLGEGPSSNKEDTRKVYKRSDYFESDTVLINSLIQKADFILVHHSHFDHLSDVPYIAKKTGAKVIGTESTVNVLKAYGVPNDQLYTVKGGEDYQFENFSVRILESIHSALNKKHYFDSRTISPSVTAPMKIAEFVEGGSLMFLARFKNHKVLTMGSMNYIEREVDGLRPDILLPGVNFSRLEIYKYTERLMQLTGFPKTVIPSHWDNFRVPYGFSQEQAINSKIKPFIEEVKAASPDSKVITPVHLETITIKE
ncbi:MBL fold metallo-hydrolase [Roseivirga sp. E12]|uniref:MBL fold metallo-hydrolase n=1 Tax=Roseivirga sp. E12 TaxID=2819237 RepID=UPI001ABC78BC|nr:MBL fold metallo-hydrolase [Roseivirga sp. E12]MBO3696876.1 MBL fold metallo-hydrolase [Roseivirga sp. E12]